MPRPGASPNHRRCWAPLPTRLHRCSDRPLANCSLPQRKPRRLSKHRSAPERPRRHLRFFELGRRLRSHKQKGWLRMRPNHGPDATCRSLNRRRPHANPPWNIPRQIRSATSGAAWGSHGSGVAASSRAGVRRAVSLQAPGGSDQRRPYPADRQDNTLAPETERRGAPNQRRPGGSDHSRSVAGPGHGGPFDPTVRVDLEPL